MDDFRRFFLRGLAALVPTLLTIAILLWVYRLVNDNVGVYITKGLLWGCAQVRDVPALPLDIERDALTYGTPINEWHESGDRLTLEYKVIHHRALQNGDPKVRARAQKLRNHALWQIAFQKYRIHLLGFFIAIILVYFVGFFLASFIGRASWRAAEGVLYRVPLIRAIYPHVKQVTDFLLSERQVEFSGVVAVRYPSREIWSIGLSTGTGMSQITKAYPDDLVTVFIPSSPTPVTGYVIQVPRRDTIELNVSIDEALRFAISGGVIKPGSVPKGALPARAK
jgi:uncharacterized membrane protein